MSAHVAAEPGHRPGMARQWLLVAFTAIGHPPRSGHGWP